MSRMPVSHASHVKSSKRGDGTILVVDDDPAIRQLTMTILLDSGFMVLEAQNGHDALACLQCSTVRLILLDLNMPVMNGWQFCEHRRQHDACALIPVLLVTAEAVAREAAAELGAHAIVDKPFEPDRLLAAVHSALRS